MTYIAHVFPDRFDVRLLGFDESAGFDPGQVLVDVFGIDMSRAREIARQVPVTIKRDLTADIAREYLQTLRAAGAQVELVRRTGSSIPVPRSDPPGAASVVERRYFPPPAPTPRISPPTLAQEPEASLPSVLLHALTYPFQRQAVPVIFGVALFSYVFGTLAGYVPFIGRVLHVVWYWGSIFAFLLGVIRASAQGQEHVPAFPEVRELSDFVLPLARFVLAVLVAFAPAMVLISISQAGAIVLGIVGLFYLPASIMIASLGSGFFTSLNVIGGVQLIARVPGPYLLLVLFSGAPLLLEAVLLGVVSPLLELLPLPFVPGFITTWLGLLPAMIGMRMYGLFLDRYEDELSLV